MHSLSKFLILLLPAAIIPCSYLNRKLAEENAPREHLAKVSQTPSVAPSTSSPTFHGGYCQKSQKRLLPTQASVCSAYVGIKAAFPTLLPPNTTSAYADLIGKSVRLAFHDAGEADLTNVTDVMGPDGCLSDSSDNAGLVESTSPVQTVLEPLWQQYCDKISRADFWVLFAYLVVEYTAQPGTVPLDYYYGRVDSHDCNAGAGRLPNPQFSLHTIERVFVTQLGLTMKDAVALIGAHTIGHVHTSASGYGMAGSLHGYNPTLNAWDSSPTVFDNKYYHNIIGIPWNNIQPDSPSTNLWQGLGPIGSGKGRVPTIMLNTDLSLGFSIGTAETPGTNGVGYTNQTCGPITVAGSYGCTNGNSGQGENTTKPYTYSQVESYTGNAGNQLFLNDFAKSFAKLVSVGYGISPARNKLGSLTYIDLTKCELEFELASSYAPSIDPTQLPSSNPGPGSSADSTSTGTSTRTVEIAAIAGGVGGLILLAAAYVCMYKLRTSGTCFVNPKNVNSTAPDALSMRSVYKPEAMHTDEILSEGI